MGVIWRARKEKRERQTEKENKEKQIMTEVLVVLARLGIIEPKVKGPKEVVTEAKRLKKAAMREKKLREAATVGAKRPASLLLPDFCCHRLFCYCWLFQSLGELFFGF